MVKRVLVNFLVTEYSLYGGTTLIRLQDISLHPTVLNFFGIVMFTWGFIFVLIGLNIMDMRSKKETNTFNILFYLIVYLSIYPAIMITSLYKKIVGKYSWGR
jgi:hypothetical protein